MGAPHLLALVLLGWMSGGVTAQSCSSLSYENYTCTVCIETAAIWGGLPYNVSIYDGNYFLVCLPPGSSSIAASPLNFSANSNVTSLVFLSGSGTHATIGAPMTFGGSYNVTFISLRWTLITGAMPAVSFQTPEPRRLVSFRDVEFSSRGSSSLVSIHGGSVEFVGANFVNMSQYHPDNQHLLHFVNANVSMENLDMRTADLTGSFTSLIYFNSSGNNVLNVTHSIFSGVDCYSSCIATVESSGPNVIALFSFVDFATIEVVPSTPKPILLGALASASSAESLIRFEYISIRYCKGMQSFIVGDDMSSLSGAVFEFDNVLFSSNDVRSHVYVNSKSHVNMEYSTISALTSASPSDSVAFGISLLDDTSGVNVVLDHVYLGVGQILLTDISPMEPVVDMNDSLVCATVYNSTFVTTVGSFVYTPPEPLSLQSCDGSCALNTSFIVYPDPQVVDGADFTVCSSANGYQADTAYLPSTCSLPCDQGDVQNPEFSSRDGPTEVIIPDDSNEIKFLIIGISLACCGSILVALGAGAIFYRWTIVKKRKAALHTSGPVQGVGPMEGSIGLHHIDDTVLDHSGVSSHDATSLASHRTFVDGTASSVNDVTVVGGPSMGASGVGGDSGSVKGRTGSGGQQNAVKGRTVSLPKSDATSLTTAATLRGPTAAGSTSSPITTTIQIDKSVDVVDLQGPEAQEVRYLGSGMFGDVYEYRYNSMPVAVKILTCVNEESVQEMVEEAQMLATLRCVYIVAYVGISVKPLAIVTEFMAGGDLANYLKSVNEGTITLNYSHLCAMAIDILRGLVYLHSKGIAHRDLKPANVLLTKYHDAKLSDFGLAGDKAKDVSGAGTPRYCAPEVLLGEPGTLASDMYSYGVLLYEILSLNRPFAGLESVNSRIENPALPPGDVSVPARTFPSGHGQVIAAACKALWKVTQSERPSASATLSSLADLENN